MLLMTSSIHYQIELMLARFILHHSHKKWAIWRFFTSSPQWILDSCHLAINCPVNIFSWVSKCEGYRFWPIWICECFLFRSPVHMDFFWFCLMYYVVMWLWSDLWSDDEVIIYRPIVVPFQPVFYNGDTVQLLLVFTCSHWSTRLLYRPTAAVLHLRDLDS